MVLSVKCVGKAGLKNPAFLFSKLAAWLALICAFSGHSTVSRGQAVYEVDVERQEFFTQCTTNRPAKSLVHVLSANITPTSADSVGSAVLVPPKGSALAFSNYGSYFHLVSQSGQDVTLSRSASAGIYQFQVISSNQTVEDFKLSLPGPAINILPLRVANFEDAQSVDASQTFTLQWDRASKGATNDYLGLTIYAPDGTRAFSVPTIALDQTNAVIPAGILEPNSTYEGNLFLRHHFFASKSGTVPYRAVLESKITHFSLRTLNPLGVLRFSAEPVIAHETEGAATVTVERTEGATGAVTVDYYTTDDTARSNVNYLAATGTLTFPPGVSSQSLMVQLLTAGIAHPPLALQVWLTNATGGVTLTLARHTILTILDSQSPPGLNVNAYLIGKAEFYSQTNTSAPTQGNLCETSRFFVTIHPRIQGAVKNAIVQLPNGSTRALAPDDDVVDYQEAFPSKASRDAAYRSGTYLLRFDTLSDGSWSLPLKLGVERVFSVPQVTNWQAAQAVDPTTPFTLQWNPFTGAATNDFVILVIENAGGDVVFRTPLAFDPGALPGTSRSVAIPDGTLDWNATYSGYLQFGKVAAHNTTLYPGVHGATVFIRETAFFLQAIGR